MVQIYELLTADGAWRGGEGARDGRQGGARTTSAGLQQQLGAVAGRRVCARRLVWFGRGAVSIDTLQLAYTHPRASLRKQICSSPTAPPQAPPARAVALRAMYESINWNFVLPKVPTN